MTLSEEEVEQAEAKANLWYGGAHSALTVHRNVQEARALLNAAKAAAAGEVDGEFSCCFDKQGQLLVWYCNEEM